MKRTVEFKHDGLIKRFLTRAHNSRGRERKIRAEDHLESRCQILF